MFSKYKPILFLTVLYLGFLGCASEELTSARLYIQQENWEKAEEYLVKALKVEPDNPEIPYQLGKLIYAKRKDWEKMNEMFDLALNLGEEKVILEGGTVKQYVEQSRSQYWANSFNKGVKTFNEFRKQSGDERNSTLEKSVLSFQEALLIDSSEPQTYPILATCYYELGKGDLAKDYAAKGAGLAGADFDANFTAGQIFSTLDDKKGGLKYFKKAVEIDPTNSSAIRYLAQSYYDLGEKEKSIDTYVVAIKNETDRTVKADLHFNLGVLYMQVGRFMDAEDNFMLAFDMNPDDIEALVGMAQTFETAEKWSRSEKFYKELIFLEPDNPEHYKGMARILLKQGKKDESEYYYNKSKRVGS
jgi:tetratricopeptide (TPR) repeat protein